MIKDGIGGVKKGFFKNTKGIRKKIGLRSKEKKQAPSLEEELQAEIDVAKKKLKKNLLDQTVADYTIIDGKTYHVKATAQKQLKTENGAPPLTKEGTGQLTPQPSSKELPKGSAGEFREGKDLGGASAKWGKMRNFTRTRPKEEQGPQRGLFRQTPIDPKGIPKS